MLKETVLLLMMIPSVTINPTDALLQPVIEAEAKPECHGDCDDKMVRILIGNEDGK